MERERSVVETLQEPLLVFLADAANGAIDQLQVPLGAAPGTRVPPFPGENHGTVGFEGAALDGRGGDPHRLAIISELDASRQRRTKAAQSQAGEGRPGGGRKRSVERD